MDHPSEGNPNDDIFAQAFNIKSSAEAVSSDKILSKISFALYGRSIEASHFTLMTEMYRHLSSMERKPISRQAIRYWFKGGKGPQRQSALVFLRSFMEKKRSILDDNGSISDQPDRRKVFNQVTKYLRRNTANGIHNAVARDIVDELGSSKDAKVSAPSGSKILINTGFAYGPLERELRSRLGYYVLYRYRMSYVGDKYIAREVIHIAQAGLEVQYRHWFLLNGLELSKFEGVAAIIGGSFWLLGAARHSVNRFRVMQFRYIADPVRKTDDLLWGIMLTDNPSSSGSEPVACRVVLVKARVVVSDPISFYNTNVRNISEREIDQKVRRMVIRLISNNNSASSFPNSFRPVTDEAGNLVLDDVLRVNQDTLENSIMAVTG